MEIEIGKNYYVRDGADHWVGELVSIDSPFVVTLKNAAWIANTGRFHEFMADGTAQNMEIEPCGDVLIMTQWKNILEWPHALFTRAI
jgi:hypothetical protein